MLILATTMMITKELNLSSSKLSGMESNRIQSLFIKHNKICPRIELFPSVSSTMSSFE